MLVSLFGGRGPRAEGDDRSVFGNFWFEPVGFRTFGGPRVSSASAMGLPAVWSCVHVLAKSFALMPFMVYEPQEAGPRKKRRDHWLYTLLKKRPNRFQTAFEFKLMLMGHLALRGNAFCQIVANSRGEVTELLPLHPDRMWCELLPGGDYRYRYVDQNGKTFYYTRGEIWHLRWLSADGIVGLSPIDVMREALGEGMSMQSYAARFYANDARPPGWIEFPGSFATKAAKLNFRETWQEMQGGRNRGKVAVLERGMKYHELGLNLADQKFIEARAANLNDIARIWGVPPHKIGALERSTNNNIEHQSIEFWTDTMWPWAEMWENSAEVFLLGVDHVPELEVEFDIKPMMRGDGAARATRIRSLVLSGVMLRNEGREEEGLDPIDGLEKPLIPVNMGIMDEDGDVEVPGGAEAGATPGAPDDGSGDRLQAMVRAACGRLARRAERALASKPAAEVFGNEFAAMVAESLAVEPSRAAAWCTKFRSAEGLTVNQIHSGLMACANGA